MPETTLPQISVEDSPSAAKAMESKIEKDTNVSNGAEGNEKKENGETSSTDDLRRRQSIIRRSLTEEGKIDPQKAEELENRLKSLFSAFTSRTKKVKAKIQKQPTPSTSEESESEASAAVEEINLKEQLKSFFPSSPDPSFFGGDGAGRRKSVVDKMKGSCKNAFLTIFNFSKCNYILDPQSLTYLSWLVIGSLCFLYNAWVVPLRVIFPYQTEDNVHIWQWADYTVDVLYLIDMIMFKAHVKFLEAGFWNKDPGDARRNYIKSIPFKIDLLCLIPVDIIVAGVYKNLPYLRLPRLLKAGTFFELFSRLDSVLANPHAARLLKTIIQMLYLIHMNACAYYAVSRYEGIGTTGWTFDNAGNAYIRCLLFGVKTATSIGKNPKPENELEYLFMTAAWLGGVFIFAVLIGQIRDIVATATKSKTEFREVMYKTVNYMQRIGVPSELQARVKTWLIYTFEQQKTLDERKILNHLPVKMRTDIALTLHIETLGKVKLFQNCEVAFLCELVTKLQSQIFLPGDYVCRKGEVGKTMYIIKSGKIQVVGGPNNSIVFASLGEGNAFGEIALLGVAGINRRTADVRSAGFSNLFVLSKDDLAETVKDYPKVKEVLRKKTKKLVKEIANKAKAEEEAKRSEKEKSTSVSKNTAGVIIKNRVEQPQLLKTLLQALPSSSMTNKYLTQGSKLSVEGKIESILTSYPPSPFVAENLGQDLNISIISGESSDEILNRPQQEKVDKSESTGESFCSSPLSMNLDSNISSPLPNMSSTYPEEDRPKTPLPEPLDEETESNLSSSNKQSYEDVRSESAKLAILLDTPNKCDIKGRSLSLDDREMLPVEKRVPCYPIEPSYDEHQGDSNRSSSAGTASPFSRISIVAQFITKTAGIKPKVQRQACVESPMSQKRKIGQLQFYSSTEEEEESSIPNAMYSDSD